MKNADQAGCRPRIRESGEYLDSWDKVAGWILLLAFVFGGTQALLAQHSQDNHGASVQEEKSQTTPLYDDTAASAAGAETLERGARLFRTIGRHTRSIGFALVDVSLAGWPLQSVCGQRGDCRTIERRDFRL